MLSTRTFRRLVVGVAVVAGATCVASCTSSADTLRPRNATTASSERVVDASYAAAVSGKRVSLMVPSGRVDLMLTPPIEQVPAEDVKSAAPLVASPGHVIVGVSWVLQRAAYADSPNRQLAAPSAIFGDPQAVQLWLTTDGTRHEIPDVGDMTTALDRPNTAVWVSAPTGVRTWQFDLAYDGVMQTVDARTGRVEAGRAAALYRPLPLDATDTCTLAGHDVTTSCIMKYAIGFPYVSGVGWAPADKTWALLEIDLESDFHGARSVTVAGAKPRTEIGGDVEPFSAFLVPSGATRLPVRGTVSAQDLDGRQVRTALTATLSPVTP